MNKQLSAKYEELVDRAPELIKCLPWGKDFEVDVFRKPDFTALEVVATTGLVLASTSSVYPWEIVVGRRVTVMNSVISLDGGQGFMGSSVLGSPWSKDDSWFSKPEPGAFEGTTTRVGR